MTDGGSPPNLVIAGVAKAGTTSLFSYLGQHPEVCAAAKKELNYFSELARAGHLPPYDEYVENFSHCRRARYRMEASPRYWWSGDAVIRAIDSTLPGVRVVILLREPTSRFWSEYTYLRSRGRLPPGMTCDEFITECQRRRTWNSSVAHGTTPLSIGFYPDFLPTWLEVFGDRLWVGFAEELFSDPRAQVDRLAAWLGIDGTRLGDIELTPRNQTVQPRSQRVARAAWSVRRHVAKLDRRRHLRRVLHSAYQLLNADRARPEMDAAARARLQSIYAESVRETAALLRDRVPQLPAWLRASPSVSGASDVER